MEKMQVGWYSIIRMIQEEVVYKYNLTLLLAEVSGGLLFQCMIEILFIRQ